MNILRRFRPVLVAIGIFLASAPLRSAEAGVEFTGYVWDDKALSIALRETKSGDSRWVAIGQEFAGYTARSLDEKAGVLVVTNGREEFRLPLLHAKVTQVAMEPPPELKKHVLNNLRQLSAAADQFFLETGKKAVTYDELVGDTKYVKRVVQADGEDYKAIQFAQGKKLEVTTAQGYVISYNP